MHTVLEVTCTIEGKDSVEKVALTDGLTTVHDIYRMLSIRYKVSPESVNVQLVRELTATTSTL